MSKCRCEYMRLIEVDTRKVLVAIDAIDQVIHATPNSTKAIWITDKYHGGDEGEIFMLNDYLKDIKQFLESLKPEREKD